MEIIMQEKNICVVCGFADIAENYLIDGIIISTHEICPSCGFQYGYSNFPPHVGLPVDTTQLDLVKYCREKWTEGGMVWQSPSLRSQPQNWDPSEQLKNIPAEFPG